MNENDNFFENVYKNVDKDNLEAIPWASLATNTHLVDYLNDRDGMTHGRALVIGSGLGDDAEALAKKGYAVDAIDISETAISMAKERFPTSAIHFRVENIFKLPAYMSGLYDFVFESRTIQSLDPKFRDELIEIITGLVAKDGVLLVHTNIQDDNENYGGPPWPLYRRELLGFEKYGLEVQYGNEKKINKPVGSYDTVVHYKK